MTFTHKNKKMTKMTLQNALLVCASVALVSAIGFETSRPVQAQAGAAPVASQQTPAPAPATVASAATPAGGANPARELVSRYCVSCHNERLKTGGLALDKLDADDVYNSAETWEKVIVKLRSRAMPPPGGRRPDNATYEAVSGYLESALDRAAAVHVNPGRPSPLHRLNRVEYANAVRDLLAVEIDAAALLPVDEQAFGFDTNGDALTMQPALLDRYLTAATKIARIALGDPTIQPAFDRYTAVKGNANEQTSLAQTDRLGEDFPLGSRGGISALHYFPVDGEYIIRLRMQRTYADVIRGLNQATQMEVHVDGQRVAEFTVGGGAALAAQAQADYREQNAEALTKADDALQVRIPMKAGLRQVVATIIKTDDFQPEGLGPERLPSWSRESDTPAVPASISSLLIGGPYNAQVPQNSASRSRIFVCTPANVGEETACATKILTTLARRAYRRQATSDDVQTLLGFYKSGRAAGNFDAGIRAAVERVLASPDFLYRIEADPEKIVAGAPYRISDVELASRLSFFLWSSIPDDQLLDLAIAGKLKDPAVLDQQVKRMLADPRGILAVTAYTTRTSPTIRGKYMLENILAAPAIPIRQSTRRSKRK